jgi:hypothetical protein
VRAPQLRLRRNVRGLSHQADSAVSGLVATRGRNPALALVIARRVLDLEPLAQLRVPAAASAAADALQALNRASPGAWELEGGCPEDAASWVLCMARQGAAGSAASPSGPHEALQAACQALTHTLSTPLAPSCSAVVAPGLPVVVRGSPFGAVAPFHFLAAQLTGAVAALLPPGASPARPPALYLLDMSQPGLPGLAGAPVMAAAAAHAHHPEPQAGAAERSLLAVMAPPLRRRADGVLLPVAVAWPAVREALQALLAGWLAGRGGVGEGCGCEQAARAQRCAAAACSARLPGCFGGGGAAGQLGPALALQCTAGSERKGAGWPFGRWRRRRASLPSEADGPAGDGAGPLGVGLVSCAAERASLAAAAAPSLLRAGCIPCGGAALAPPEPLQRSARAVVLLRCRESWASGVIVEERCATPGRREGSSGSGRSGVPAQHPSPTACQCPHPCLPAAWPAAQDRPAAHHGAPAQPRPGGGRRRGRRAEQRGPAARGGVGAARPAGAGRHVDAGGLQGGSAGCRGNRRAAGLVARPP